VTARYLHPFTDYGFKKLFGEEASKPLLMDFLNSFLPLPENGKITELSFNNNERLPSLQDSRGAVFDIFCDTANGEKIIVEMQKAKQKFFKDRTIFYSSFPIQEQAQAGNWDFQLKAVFCVGVLDFTFDEAGDSEPKEEVVHKVMLKDQNNKVFYDKLTFVYLELPHFKKTPDALKSRLDQWLYFLKNLPQLEDLAKIFGDDPIFEKAGKVAELASMTREQRWAYELSMKDYRDIKNVIDYAVEVGSAEAEARGLARGFALGMAELALLLLEAKFGALPSEFVEKIKNLPAERLRDLTLQQGNLTSLAALETWLT
jgi:predicted transposase/invertase (TIGR01784 family)